MNNTKYKPIACSFYDYLLELSTKRSLIEVKYNYDGKTQSINSTIVDVFTEKGAEFIKLENGNLIRLDILISVNGQSLDCKTCQIS